MNPLLPVLLGQNFLDTNSTNRLSGFEVKGVTMYQNGSPIASQIPRIGRTTEVSPVHILARGSAGVRGNLLEHLSLPSPRPQTKSICILQSFLSKHFLVRNQQLPRMGLDLLGVHRITLIHYDLASLYDFLVVFLPHPSPYRKLDCLPNTQEKGQGTQLCLGKPNPQVSGYSSVPSAHLAPLVPQETTHS